MTSGDGQGPLSGLKVLELGAVLAGPLVGTFLADFGADVVHVEKPAVGDPMRVAGPATTGGLHVWWKITMRNKRSVTLDISQRETHGVLARLVEWADVVIENFKPGTLERWGIPPSELLRLNPRLVILRISGFGQSGPMSRRPGFGKVGEAMSGQVALTGFPDNPPTHVGFSLGDTTTAVMGALGVMIALYGRGRNAGGEVIDLALYDTLFRLIEWQVPAYDTMGFVGHRSGNRFPFGPAILANAYQASDGVWITVSTATQEYVDNCVRLLGEGANDYLAHVDQPGAADLLDASLAGWMRARPSQEALQKLEAANVVCSTIYTVEDIVNDETYRVRGSIVEVEDRDFGTLRQPAPVPHFQNHPGKIWREAPLLGADNAHVYRSVLGIPAETLEDLQERGLI